MKKSKVSLVVVLMLLTLGNVFAGGIVNNGAVIRLNNNIAVYVNGDSEGDFVNQTSNSTDGTLTGDGTLSLEGDWTNSASTSTIFTDSSSITVNLTGADQAISGSTSFPNLTKNVSSEATLTFPAGSSTTITSTLNLQGVDGQSLKLRSSTDGTQWEINPQGTKTLSYLDIKDSNNTNSTAIDVISANCTDSGNNTNWTFNETFYTVTFSTDGNGTLEGETTQTVSSGSSCTAVTAVPNSGYNFTNWSNDSTDNPLTVSNVTSDMTITANFAVEPSTAVSLTLSTSPADGGTTNPTSGSTSSYAKEQEITITATPTDGYNFAGWAASSGATIADVNSASTTVVLSADATVTAYFSETPPELIEITMAVSQDTGGTTAPTAGTVISIFNDLEQSITATPADGYNFVGWKADPATNAIFANASSTSTTVSASASATITAEFSKLPVKTAVLTMAVNSDSSGTTSPTAGETTVSTGVAQNISATAISGYKFFAWISSKNALIEDTSAASTTVTLSGDATVTALFASEEITSSELTINKLRININSGTQDKDQIKITMQQPAGFSYDRTNSDFKLQLGECIVIIPAGSTWKESKNPIFKEIQDSGVTKICLNDKKKTIDVTLTKASLANAICTSTTIDIYLTIGNNIYIGSVEPNDKSQWKFVSSSNVEGFTADVTKFSGNYCYKDSGTVATYKFQLSGSGLTDPTTNGYNTDFTPKVYLDEAEWDFSEIIPKEKNNKFTYSLKDGTQTLYLCLDFNKEKWSFKAIDKNSDLGANVSKSDSVRFILSLESDTETITSINDIDVTVKTTLK